MQQVLRNSLLAAIATVGLSAMATTPLLRPVPAPGDGRVAPNTLHQSTTKATSSVRILGNDYQPTHKAPAAGIRADVLAEEDFSNLTEGTPDQAVPVVEYGVGTMPVPDGMLNSDGWNSNSFYSAGGAAKLLCSNPQYAATLSTPLGDWSGSITVTVRVRPLKCTWGGQRARFQMAPMAYGENFANTNMERPYFEFILLDREGWAEITMTYENYTADNEGYIMFAADSDVLIDDLKITSQTDFLPVPVMLKLTDVKEDGFTINWMPVRKAREYYIHLYSLDGENEDGTPRLKREWPAEFTQEDIDMYQDWVEQGWLTPDYLAYEQALMATSYTFKGLDPNKEYYYCVQAHLIDKFSSMDENYHAMFVASPELLPATNVDREAGAYTANWSPVAKADGYYVTNYGVHTVAQDTPDFVIMHEDFDNMPSEAEGIENIETPESGIDNSAYLNWYTGLPGWTCKYLGYTQGMAGVSTAFNGFITTPNLDVENADNIRVKLGIQAQTAGQNMLITFAGVSYRLHLDDNATYSEVEFELPTNNYVESPICFYSQDGQSLFLLDYVTVSQALKAGSHVCVFQKQKEAGANETSMDFSDLDFGAYDTYAYMVTSYYSFYEPLREINEYCTSRYAGRQLVDSEPLAVDQLGTDMVKSQTPAQYYDLTGRRVANPNGGVFIKVQDGKSIKVKL